LALISLAITTIYCLVVFFTTEDNLGDLFYFPYTNLNAIGPLQTIYGLFIGSTLWEIGQFFYSPDMLILIPVNIVCFSFAMFTTFQLLKKSAKKQVAEPEEQPPNFKNNLLPFFKTLIVVSVLYGLMLTKEIAPSLAFFVIILSFPPLLLWGFIANWEKKNVFTNLSNTFHLLGGQYFQMLQLFGILLITAAAFFLLFDTAFVVLVFEFIGLNFSLEQSAMDALAMVVLTFMAMFMVFLISMMVMTGFGLLYFSLVETKEASHLKKSIQDIGSGKRIRGLERE
jgi:hypothetical protein